MKISKEQQSVLAIGCGFFLFSYLYRNYFFLIPGIFFCLLVFISQWNKPVHKYWMLIAEKLGWISSHCLLFILFYFFLTPIAFLRRLAGKNEMIVALKGRKSIFKERNHFYIPKDFENPW